MISIIVSSYNESYVTALEQNIADTIGVEYEIIKIANPGLMGISEAYNKGTQKAKYDILCFTHEDVEIKTNNWGNKVVTIFNNDCKIGLLGVAGNIYKPITPCHWSFPTANGNSFFVNVIQGNTATDPATSFSFYSNPKNALLQYVAAIDGCWFCAPRKVVMELPFDPVTCPGFHAYDVDYSLTVQEKYKIAVTFEVLIQHFSEGNFNRQWIDATIKVHHKWKKKLPVLLERFDGFNQQEEEVTALIFFMKKMVDYDYPIFEIFKIYRFQNKNFKFSFRSYISTLYRLIGYKYFNDAKNFPH